MTKHLFKKGDIIKFNPYYSEDTLNFELKDFGYTKMERNWFLNQKNFTIIQEPAGFSNRDYVWMLGPNKLRSPLDASLVELVERKVTGHPLTKMFKN